MKIPEISHLEMFVLAALREEHYKWLFDRMGELAKMSIEERGSVCVWISGEELWKAVKKGIDEGTFANGGHFYNEALGKLEERDLVRTRRGNVEEDFGKRFIHLTEEGSFLCTDILQYYRQFLAKEME